MGPRAYSCFVQFLKGLVGLYVSVHVNVAAAVPDHTVGNDQRVGRALVEIVKVFRRWHRHLHVHGDLP